MTWRLSQSIYLYLSEPEKNYKPQLWYYHMTYIPKQIPCLVPEQQHLPPKRCFCPICTVPLLTILFNLSSCNISLKTSTMHFRWYNFSNELEYDRTQCQCKICARIHSFIETYIHSFGFQKKSLFYLYKFTCISLTQINKHHYIYLGID